MGPHVASSRARPRRRQCIEGDPFCPVEERYVAVHSAQSSVAEHSFDYTAGFNAARRISGGRIGEDLVPIEHACRQPVVLIDVGHRGQSEAPQSGVTGESIENRGPFQRLSVVDVVAFLKRDPCE